MPEEPILPPRDIYYVLVEGQMNPAIHHAQWYRNIGAIDEAEFQEALKNLANVTGPAGAVVDIASAHISISCQPGQWWAQTTDVTNWQRIVEIASLVFSKLDATPLQSYGLMSQRHVVTKATEVKAVLTKAIIGLGLGFPVGPSTNSSLQLSVVEEDYTVDSILQPSRLGEGLLFGYYYCKYTVPKPPFDIASLVRARLPRFEATSAQFFNTAAEAVGELGRAVRKEQSDEEH